MLNSREYWMGVIAGEGRYEHLSFSGIVSVQTKMVRIGQIHLILTYTFVNNSALFFARKLKLKNNGDRKSHHIDH